MHFVAIILLLCLVNSVCCVDLHHASSAAGTWAPSRNIHSRHHSHSYSFTYSYSYSRSHSRSSSHFKSYATNTPLSIHNQIEKRNIIDFSKKLISSKSNVIDTAISALYSNSAFPSPPATKNTFEDNNQANLHVSIGFGGPVLRHSSAASLIPSAPSHTSASSRYARVQPNVSLSSLSFKASSSA